MRRLLVGLFLVGVLCAQTSIRWRQLRQADKDTGLDAKFLDKGGGVFNIKAYGAMGIGTDDTHAIQAVLDAVGAAGGGVVYAPQGTYLLHAHLVASSSTELVGAGVSTVFKVANAQLPAAPPSTNWGSPSDPNVLTALTTTAGATKVRFYNFTLDMNGVNQSNKPQLASLSISNGTFSTFERVQVINAWHRGAMFSCFGTDCSNNRFLNNVGRGPGAATPDCVKFIGPGGIFLQGAGNLVQGNYVDGLCDEAYIANGSEAFDNIFSNNRFVGYSTASAFHAEDNSGGVFTNNTCTGRTGACFNVAPSGVGGLSMTDIVVAGNQCTPNEVDSTSPSLCVQMLGDGLGHTVKRAVVSGNIARGLQEGSGTGFIVGAEHSSVQDNIVQSSKVGVQVVAGGTNSIVVNNILTGNDTDLMTGGPPAGTVVYPNVFTGDPSQVYLNSILRGIQLQGDNTIGQNLGTAFSYFTGNLANGLLRLFTNLNPITLALLDAATPGWGIDQNAAGDIWQMWHRAVGAGAATSPISFNGATSSTVLSYSLTMTGVPFASLGAPANGTIQWCTDCLVTCLAAAGPGSWCKRAGGVWAGF